MLGPPLLSGRLRQLSQESRLTLPEAFGCLAQRGMALQGDSREVSATRFSSNCDVLSRPCEQPTALFALLAQAHSDMTRQLPDQQHARGRPGPDLRAHRSFTPAHINSSLRLTSPEYFPRRQRCPLSSPVSLLIKVTPDPSPHLLLRHSTAQEVFLHLKDSSPSLLLCAV